MVTKKRTLNIAIYTFFISYKKWLTYYIKNGIIILLRKCVDEGKVIRGNLKRVIITKLRVIISETNERTPSEQVCAKQIRVACVKGYLRISMILNLGGTANI